MDAFSDAGASITDLAIPSDPALPSAPSLPALLGRPSAPAALVVFAHGSGSGRLSPRNQAVARRLEAAGLATLLLDLLTPEESDDRASVFDVELLAARLLAARAWARANPGLRDLPIGYFGASTGAAAALVAAAREPAGIAAVVSRGGRPDLAAGWLERVAAPTLLIVGGLDRQVLELNEAAFVQLRCAKELAVVPGAGHLFEERGALEQVADLAADWFRAQVDPARV